MALAKMVRTMVRVRVVWRARRRAALHPRLLVTRT